MDVLHRYRVVIAISLVAAGCYTQQDMTLVGLEYPRDQIAYLHCSFSCREVIDDNGSVIVSRNDWLGYSLGTIELTPGVYTIKLTYCRSYLLLPDGVGEQEIELHPGRHYYVKHDGTETEGNYSCARNLNVYYSEDGSDQPEKTEKARTVSAELREKLANCGDAEQQYILGILYQMQTPPEDYEPVLAYKLLSLAADAHRRRDALPLLKRLRALMSPNQIAEAEKLIAEWEPAKEGCE